MTEPEPTISILLPVFNGAAFLREQVASILAQTCHDFELLIHDDGSTDGSSEALRSMAAVDRRIALSVTPTNSGQKFVLRGLLLRASGRYVAFADQDDVWHPQKLEVLLAAIGDAALSYGSSKLIDAAGSELGRTIFDFNGAPIDGRDNTDFLFRSVVSGHALLARREVIDPGVFLLGTEYDWLVAVLATFGRGVVHVPEAISYHRQHDGNQVNAFGAAHDRTKSRSKHWHRVMRLHDALCVLRASNQIADDKRAIFGQLYRALRDELLLAPRAPVFNHRFAARFAQALQALAVDAPHRTRAIKAVDKICRGVLHPKTIRDVLAGW